MSEYLNGRKGCRVTGVELNPEAARLARAHCEAVVVGDVEDQALSRVQGPFDVVLFADVLEHLRAPARVLQQVHGLLKPEGYAVVSLPNVANWQVRLQLVRGRFEYTPEGLLDESHLRFFTYASAVRFFDGCGFGVERFELVYRFPRHWRLAGFYRRWDRQINRLVRRHLRDLVGYQFIFKIRPRATWSREPAPAMAALGGAAHGR
jgi:SAM-dependent methyltransferase